MAGLPVNFAQRVTETLPVTNKKDSISVAPCLKIQVKLALLQLLARLETLSEKDEVTISLLVQVSINKLSDLLKMPGEQELQDPLFCTTLNAQKMALIH